MHERDKVCVTGSEGRPDSTNGLIAQARMRVSWVSAELSERRLERDVCWAWPEGQQRRKLKDLMT